MINDSLLASTNQKLILLFNRSSEWGTHPWHWYFTNALPKSQQVVLGWVLVAVGIVFWTSLSQSSAHSNAPPNHATKHQNHSLDTANDDRNPRKFIGLQCRRALYYLSPAVLFIALYSILPHKVFIQSTFTHTLLKDDVGLIAIGTTVHYACLTTLRADRGCVCRFLFDSILRFSPLVSPIFIAQPVHNFIDRSTKRCHMDVYPIDSCAIGLSWLLVADAHLCARLLIGGAAQLPRRRGS